MGCTLASIEHGLSTSYRTKPNSSGQSFLGFLLDCGKLEIVAASEQNRRSIGEAAIQSPYSSPASLREATNRDPGYWVHAKGRRKK